MQCNIRSDVPMTATRTTAVLRRTVTPYIGQTVIIAGVTILLVYVAQKKLQWDLLWAVAVIWVLFASYVFFFAMKYKVLWNEAGVTMTASGGPARNIRFDEITEIRYETASASEFLSQSRPFRRVVIVGRRRDPHASIDISLRYFEAEDIDRLLMAIGKQRPDIALPHLSLGSGRVAHD